MRLDEITRDEFKQRLADPAYAELWDIIEEFNDLDNDVSTMLDLYNPEKASFSVMMPKASKNEKREMIRAVAIRVESSQHWDWDGEAMIKARYRDGYSRSSVTMYVKAK